MLDAIRELGVVTGVIAVTALVGGLFVAGIGSSSVAGGAPPMGHTFALAATPAPESSGKPGGKGASHKKSASDAKRGKSGRDAPADGSENGAHRGSAGGEAAARVEMTNTLQFKPAEVTITAGEAVKWVNVSALRHTVTADPEKATKEASVRLPKGAEPFDSGLLKPDATYKRSFDEPGRYRYFCKPHEGTNMRGDVIVKPAR